MDIYSSLSFVSGVAITTLAVVLLLVRIEPDEERAHVQNPVFEKLKKLSYLS